MHAHAGSGHDAADARRGALQRRENPRDARCIPFAHAEAKFVIVASGQREVASLRGGKRFMQGRRKRQRIRVDFRADAAARADVAEVREQAVGDIDARGRDAAQGQPCRDARLRPVEPFAQCRKPCRRMRLRFAQRMQRRRRVAQRTRDENRIADLRAGARQRGLFGHEAQRGHRDAQRPARGIAADQRDLELPRQFRETVGEVFDEVRIGLRQGQRQHRPRRLRPHRGEVRQVHGQRFPADVARRSRFRKMHARDQRIGARGQPLSRRHVEQRGIVADAEANVGARQRGAAMDQVDQIEFAHVSAPLRTRRSATRAPVCPARR